MFCPFAYFAHLPRLSVVSESDVTEKNEKTVTMWNWDTKTGKDIGWGSGKGICKGWVKKICKGWGTLKVKIFTRVMSGTPLLPRLGHDKLLQSKILLQLY